MVVICALKFTLDLWFLLSRLNCPEAAMRSLQLARQHAASKHERLVYEGWILYDTGHCEEGLHKAEESISIQRSFEAFFLKAYALADSNLDPSSFATVISLLEDALKCPSDRLRKGQVCITGFTLYLLLFNILHLLFPMKYCHLIFISPCRMGTGSSVPENLEQLISFFFTVFLIKFQVFFF